MFNKVIYVPWLSTNDLEILKQTGSIVWDSYDVIRYTGTCNVEQKDHHYLIQEIK